MCFSKGNYYIAFTILSEAMESLNVPHAVNVVLNYLYLGLLVLCFILSLGNRPQGSKWGYTTAFIGFGFITIYMTVCLPFSPFSCEHLSESWTSTFWQTAAFLLAFKSIHTVAAGEGRPLQITDVFTNVIFRDIILSLLATLGLYILASLIFVSHHHYPQRVAS